MGTSTMSASTVTLSHELNGQIHTLDHITQIVLQWYAQLCRDCLRQLSRSITTEAGAIQHIITCLQENTASAVDSEYKHHGIQMLTGREGGSLSRGRTVKSWASGVYQQHQDDRADS